MPAQFFRGRLLDHVHLHAQDLEASRKFYRATLTALGLGDAFVDGGNHIAADELWIDGDPAGVTHIHLAFQARDRAAVDAFYAAGLAAGGKDHGAPGERHYHPGYYAAFLLDPDGNNIEAVFHGPAKRSAAAVVFTPGG